MASKQKTPVLEELTEQDAAAELQDREQVQDEASADDTVAIESYDITSFGADYDVEGLVKRLNRNDIFTPEFQRDYVWNLNEASRFIESLLLGLPVPGVFLAREQESNRLLIIDGQQRLKTLQFFYNGYFNPRQGDNTKRVFKLTKVQPKFEGLSYETLEKSDRVKLNDSIIHATIVKQESPVGEDTSIYYIFERLNDGGRRLAPQEIRAAIYHGKLLEEIKQMNKFEKWRLIYGKQSHRLKDQELILRFLSFLDGLEEYKRPMNEFINKFTAKNRNPRHSSLSSWRTAFEGSIGVLFDAVGRTAFRPEATINAAVFDSVMVGMARRVNKGPITGLDVAKKVYEDLLANPNYNEAVSRSTADEKFVRDRIQMATDAFAKVP